MEDPLAERIAEKQRKAFRAMNTPQQNAEWDRENELWAFKSKLRDLLKTDPKFREEIRTILNSQE